MARPKGMFLRGSIWWARKDVPKKLVKIVGTTSLQESLHTGDQGVARVRLHVAMAKFEARIERARKNLAGAVTSPLLFEVPMDAARMEMARLLNAYKPEFQIRDALEQANLIRPKKTEIKLDEVFKQWVKERQPTANTAAEYSRARDIFIELNGNLPVAEYTTDHARKWKQYTVDLKYNGKPVAHATKEKNFGAVTTLFRFADRNDYLSANPFAKITLEKPKRAKVNQRQEWDRDELRKLFRSPVYADGKRFIAGGGEAVYWLPVLACQSAFNFDP